MYNENAQLWFYQGWAVTKAGTGTTCAPITPVPSGRSDVLTGEGKSTIEDVVLQHEIEQALFDEAALLDAHDYTAWLDTLAEDVTYWMPTSTPALSLSTSSPRVHHVRPRRVFR